MFSASLKSCLNQTFDDFELLVVDDASTDGTSALVSEFMKLDPRVALIHSGTNIKLPAALNLGFQHSKGDYITWTSDDNLYRPHALSRLVAELRENPSIGVVYADQSIIDETGDVISRDFLPPPDHLAHKSCIGACFMYRREVHLALNGYDKSKFLVEDYDFWLRASMQFSFLHLPEDLYLYRRHGQSLSSQRQNEILEATAQLIRAYLPKLPYAGKTQQCLANWKLAYIAKELGQASQGLACVGKAIKLWPTSLFQQKRLRFILSLLKALFIERSTRRE